MPDESSDESSPKKMERLAQTLKDFLAQHQQAVLSTISKTVEGFPFGSITPYDLTSDGAPVICISKISQHYKNLIANPKASLLVQSRFGSEDPQAHSRATVLGLFTPVEDSYLEQTRSSFSKRFPNSPARQLAHDFVYFSCELKRLRWIGGFGQISWVSAEDYNNAKLDPISYAGRGIIDHMNRDHRDALAQYANIFSEAPIEIQNCEMRSVNSREFTILVETREERTQLTVKFPQELNSLQEVRTAMIGLLKNKENQ